MSCRKSFFGCEGNFTLFTFPQDETRKQQWIQLQTSNRLLPTVLSIHVVSLTTVFTNCPSMKQYFQLGCSWRTVLFQLGIVSCPSTNWSRGALKTQVYFVFYFFYTQPEVEQLLQKRDMYFVFLNPLTTLTAFSHFTIWKQCLPICKLHSFEKKNALKFVSLTIFCWQQHLHPHGHL